MKVIKFRVWTGHQMLKPFSLMDIQNEKACVSVLDIVMQFTGLVDKNGTEIYEGDILKLWTGGEEQSKPSILDSLEDLYIWMNEDDYYYAVTDFEVVGNKYENPDIEYLE